jgi:hypothetical protein
MPWPEMLFSSGFYLNVTTPNVILISFFLKNGTATLTNVMVTIVTVLSVVLLRIMAPNVILSIAVLLNVMTQRVEQLRTVVSTKKIF